jgi:hypothetical protein
MLKQLTTWESIKSMAVSVTDMIEIAIFDAVRTRLRRDMEDVLRTELVFCIKVGMLDTLIEDLEHVDIG